MTRTTTLHASPLVDSADALVANRTGPEEATKAAPSPPEASGGHRAHNRKPTRARSGLKRQGGLGTLWALLGCALLAWLWTPGGVAGFLAEMGIPMGTAPSPTVPTGAPEWPGRAESFLRFLATAFGLYWFVRRDIKESEDRTNRRIDEVKDETRRGFDRLEDLMLRLVDIKSRPG